MKPVPRGKLVSFISWMTPAHPVCGYIHLYVHCSCECVCTHTQHKHLSPPINLSTRLALTLTGFREIGRLSGGWGRRGRGRAVIRMQWQWFHHNHGSEEMQSLSKDDIWTDDTRWMSLVWNLNTQNTLGWVEDTGVWLLMKMIDWNERLSETQHEVSWQGLIVHPECIALLAHFKPSSKSSPGCCCKCALNTLTW